VCQWNDFFSQRNETPFIIINYLIYNLLICLFIIELLNLIYNKKKKRNFFCFLIKDNRGVNN
jgi:hypothetical protein